MKLEQIFGYIIFAGFGFWWALAPKSVIKFYTWFHRKAGNWASKEFKMPTPLVIREVGAMLVLFITVIMFFSTKAK